MATTLYCFHCLPVLTRAVTLSQGQAQCRDHALESKQLSENYAKAIVDGYVSTGSVYEKYKDSKETKEAPMNE